MGADQPIVRKVAVAFRKEGGARHHSHHDMMRYVERALRRSGLPVRHTSGHNPRPRLVFPHALGVGVASGCEAVEVELTRAVPPAEAQERLTAAFAPVLAVRDLWVLPPRVKGQKAVEIEYRVSGWPPEAELEAAAAAVLAEERLTLVRAPKGREVDVRPWLKTIRIEGGAAVVRAGIDETGSVRPDEIVRLLADRSGSSAEGVRVEKTAMTLLLDGRRRELRATA